MAIHAQISTIIFIFGKLEKPTELRADDMNTDIMIGTRNNKSIIIPGARIQIISATLGHDGEVGVSC